MTSLIKKITNRYILRYVNHYAGLSRKCWHGIVLSFIESFLIGLYSFLPLYFVNNLNYSVVAAGALISFYGLGAVIGGYLSGKLSDCYHPGLLTLSSLLLQSLAFFSLIKLTGLYPISLVMMVMGIASYGFLTSLNLWVLNECENDEQQKLKALNILNAASNLGSGLSAICIGFLIFVGFNQLFYVVASLLFISACYFSTVLSSSSSKPSLIKKDIVTQPATKSLLPMWIMLLCLFLVGLIIFQANTTFSIYIQQTFPQLGIKAVSILFAINCFMVVLLQTPLINKFANYNKLIIAGIGAFLLGAGMFMLVFAYSFVFAMIAYAIHTIGEMLFFGVAQFICYESASAQKKGQAMGLFRTIYASSRVVAPTLGALIYDMWGSATLWYLCGALGFLCFEACNLSKKMM